MSSKLPAIFIIFISLFAFQKNVFADKFQIAEEYRLRGFEEQEKGNLDDSLQWYTKSLSLVPNNAVIYNDMGVVYEQLGLLDRAEEQYLRAVQIDSDYLPPYMNLAYLYLRRGDSETAAFYFEKRIERAPPNDAWATRAKEELRLLDPHREERRQAAMAKEVARVQEELIAQAREEFQKEIVRADKHYRTGIEMAESGEYEGAIAEFDRALLLTPENPKIQRAKREAQQAQLKLDVAKHSQEALKHLDMGDADSAKNEFRKILTIIPNEPIQ